MNAYYKSNDFNKALDVVQKVLEIKQLNSKIKWDAYDILAHASLKINDSLSAKKAFKVLEKSPVDELAAEAYYFDAYHFFLIKDYKKSNEIIADLSQNSVINQYGLLKVYCLWLKTFIH